MTVMHKCLYLTQRGLKLANIAWALDWIPWRGLSLPSPQCFTIVHTEDFKAYHLPAELHEP